MIIINYCYQSINWAYMKGIYSEEKKKNFKTSIEINSK